LWSISARSNGELNWVDFMDTTNTRKGTLYMSEEDLQDVRKGDGTT
jgi:hypothetical protein